jgi:cell division protein FtsQ
MPPRSRNRTRRQKSLPGWGIGLALAAGAMIAFLNKAPIWKQVSSLFPMGYVRVEGEFANVDPVLLENALSPYKIANFFSVDPQEVAAALGAVPWIGAARVAKAWPDTLVIHVDERVPVARWGDVGLIDRTGTYIPAKDQVTRLGDLPKLEAPKGRETEAIELLDRLNAGLFPPGMDVRSVAISDRLSRVIVLSNGLQLVFGTRDPVEATRQFLSLLPRMGVKSLDGLNTVDFRYPRGFAVTWKSVEPMGPPRPVDEHPRVRLKSG